MIQEFFEKCAAIDWFDKHNTQKVDGLKKQAAGTPIFMRILGDWLSWANGEQIRIPKPEDYGIKQDLFKCFACDKLKLELAELEGHMQTALDLLGESMAPESHQSYDFKVRRRSFIMTEQRNRINQTDKNKKKG